ncbi:MAG: response regulator [Bacteroidetes bacterium]|nr:response regulator [Bacteroidota bacterium]MBU1422309.1 response regulator [Bacteroidota bacterium]
MKSKKPILLVEDDQVDVMTVKRALKDIHVTNKLDIAVNGAEALEFLRNSKKEKPCIILLDLDMPKMNGIEFLKIVKQDERLRRIPVVILTTSEEEQDMVNSFNLGVAGYMLKPVGYHQFVETARAIDLYWTLSKLPEEG